MKRAARISRRAAALLLAAALLASSAPLRGAAAAEDRQPASVPASGAQPVAIRTADGDVPVDENWNEAYPYGTFAFGSYQADVGEAGAKNADGETLPESVRIPVYRLGGTTGRVTALITFAPAITTDPSGTEFVYDYAASGRDDILVEIEDPSPLAAYQTLGAPRWQLEMQPGAEAALKDQGEPAEGDSFTAELPDGLRADSYRWQAYADGLWKDVQGAEETGGSITMDWSLLWDFDRDAYTGMDLRCVYSVDGAYYCSTSLLGEVYEPVAAPEPVPETLDASAEPGYTPLEPDETFGLYEFPLTFADGETVKYIRVTARDDETAELPEMALFTITGCEGGETSSVCNTLTLMVSDNDAGGASTLGFTDAALTASRAESTVKVPIRREGDTSYNVTIRYRTEDGTAKAGVDYAQAEGELSFAGSVDELELPIELIANDATEDRTFDVVLEDQQGGGTDGRCAFTTTRVTVTVTGSAPAPDAAGRNLATVLADRDGTELSEGLTVSDEPLLADNRTALSGHTEMDPLEPVAAELVIDKTTPAGGASPNMVRMAGKYVFTRPANYSGYWKDWEILLGTEGTGSDCADTSQGMTVAMTYLNFDLSGNPPPSGAYFNDTKGTRDGVYGAVMTNATWDGYKSWTKNGSFNKAKFGNLFYRYLIDVEWKQPGVQSESTSSRNYRFLLPVVQVNQGKNLVSNYTTSELRFFAKGDGWNNKYPDEMTVRAFTNGSGWGSVRGASWNNVEPTSQGCTGNAIDFGQDMEFVLNLEHCYCWYADGTHSLDDMHTSSHKGRCNDPESHVDIRRFSALRRYFNQTGEGSGIDLVLYTANDENEIGGGYLPVSESSTLYGQLAPQLYLVSDKSGVTGGRATSSENGCLYLGSQIQVVLPGYEGFVVPDNGLFLTNSQGTRVGTVERTGENEFYITMMWNGIGTADENEKYSLHVIYNRKQNLIIDLTPSVPHSAAEPTALIYDQIAPTWESFIANQPTGVTAAENPGTVWDERAFTETQTFTWDSSNFKLYKANPEESDETAFKYQAQYEFNGTVSNLQRINFHQDPRDVIVFNGRGYAGDADITLSLKDLSAKDLIFTYYNKDCKKVVSLMELKIDSVRLYYDRDGDGTISGTYDRDEGIFEVSKPDEFLGPLEGEYPESLFKPALDKQNHALQYYFLVKYRLLRPRALELPDGASEDDRAQLLPAFTSAISNPDALAGKQKEELAYNWVVSDNCDGKLMYGEEATDYDYVLIPLGGDVSRVTMTSHETINEVWDLDENGEKIPDTKKKETGIETVYDWQPQYVGSLLVPHPDPADIVIEENITGHPVPIGGNDPDSAEGKANINAYLGSFVGRSGFALGIQQQTKPSSGAGGISSPEDVKPESVSLGDVFTTPNADGVNGIAGLGDDAEDTEAEGPGGEIGMEEFAPDLGTELPSLEFGLGDYFAIVTDGYEVGFTFGIPVFKKEDTNYSGSNKVTEENGIKREKYTDQNGTEHETITNDNDGTVKKITTEYDKTNPTKRTVYTETTTPDPNGGTPTTKTTKETEKWERGSDGKKKWTEHSETREEVSNRPSSPSNPSPANPQGRFRRGLHEWHEANGQIDTLNDFREAVLSRDRTRIRGFGNGLFNDNDDFTQAKKGNSKMRKVELSFSVQLAIMFEFNPIDNTYYFKSGTVSASLGFEITLQARLPACPAFYVYLKFGAEVEFSLGFRIIRNAELGNEITDFVSGSPAAMQAGENRLLIFKLDMRKDGAALRGFHMDLNGDVYMSVYDNRGMEGHALTCGALCGDGGTKEILFEDYDKIVYVCLEARGTVWPEITNLVPVLGAVSKPVFDGFNITPSLSLEVGAGVGVELLKLEIYLKTNIAITMSMGGYVEELDSHEGFYISGFEWSIALGFNVTALFFNYSMDLIAFGVEGAQMGTGGYFTWDISATAANGAETIWSKTTYTTSSGEALDYPTEAGGVNIFRGVEGMIFYNPDGTRTDTSPDAPRTEGWSFSEDVSANRWGGGAYDGEIPLERDLAIARKDEANVLITTNEQKIDLYFDGKITIARNGSYVIPDESPVRLEFNGSAPYSFRVSATKGTSLDRFCAPPAGDASPRPRLQRNAPEQTLVHVNAPRDVSDTQQVLRAGDDPDAFDPTGTSDFQLSGYNTAGDAKKLVGGLTGGYTCRAATAGGETYLAYPLMLDGKPQLVLSRLVMTGDLNGAGTGFVHPLDPDAETPYLLLDNDGYTDLDFALRGSDDALTVCWVSYANATESWYTVRSRTLTAGGELGGIRTLSTASPSFRSMPSVHGDGTLWAEASGSGDEENELLKEWLIAANPGLTEPMLDGLSVSEPSMASSVFYWATQSMLNELNGESSILRASSGKSAEVNGVIGNLEAVELDGKTYVLYSTTQTAYFDGSAETPVTVDFEGIDKDTERGSIHRLYLCTLDTFGFSEPRLLQTVIDFNGCSENNLREAKLKDGVYLRGALEKAQADPYFSNLSFVRADIDGTGVQTVALFEMGGNSYLLRQADLRALANGAAGATVTPVFSETMGTEVTIGSDGTNLAAVYTAPVADSQSNAIFVAWWDANTASWGAPTILAMRNLQIYEDRITWDMQARDVEQAYLGKLTTPGGNTGTPDKLTFSGLQMVAQTAQMPGGAPKTMLTVLTEGSLTEYTDATFDMGEGREPFVTMVPAGEAEVGFYAIAFGAGEQALGEATLCFANPNFSEGSELIGEVSFTNTGTAAIRASEANPATITLYAGDQEISVWRCIRTVASGEKLRLTFSALPLSSTLPTGTKFSLRVSEDQEYFINGFSATLDDLLTVEEKPELSFGDFEVKLSGVGSDAAYLAFDASVLNNGSGAAREVFLQFSYDTGLTDDYGNEIYKPVDITGSVLETSAQQPIPKGAVTENYAQGVYRLKDTYNNTNLDTNYYRSVSGTLRVPTECFVDGTEVSGLHLRCEIFSDADEPDLRYGVYTSEHNEYDAGNNRAQTTVKHRTEFSLPPRISTALGTTLTLPISFRSTSAQPDIVIREISDGTDNWEPCMGICYYDPERSVLVAAPNAHAQQLLSAGQTPTGILQVTDQATNSFAAITYKVSSMAQGVNIYKDDATFTFCNADGSTVDPENAEGADWSFLGENDVFVWYDGEGEASLPMNNDILRANRDGAYLTFDTVASSIKLFFSGEVTIASSEFGSPQTFTQSPAYLDFGNDAGLRHTVTVTAKKDTLVDRYVAAYKINTVPSTDPNEPKMLWNRSFPDTASLHFGDSVPMTCYVVDDTGIQSVVWNGQTLSETTTPKLVKLDEGLWYFDFTFTKNGVYSGRTVDSSGNTGRCSVTVDWFNDVLSAGANAMAPALRREHLSFVDAGGAPIDTTAVLREAPYLVSSFEPAAGEETSAYLFDGGFSGSALGKVPDEERWIASFNGYYMVRAERKNGTWARAIIPLTNLALPTQNKPELSGSGTPGDPYLVGSFYDWLSLVRFVNSGGSTAGVTFLQTADIDTEGQLSHISVGMTPSRPFRGVYDGGGHALVLSETNPDSSCAPFRYASGATFRNLRIEGSINRPKEYTAALCAHAEDSVTVINCRSAVTIDSTRSTDTAFANAGFIAFAEPDCRTVMIGCVFAGELLGRHMSSSGVFLGLNHGSATFRDCLCAPQTFEWFGAETFCYDEADELQNCYYTLAPNDDQGLQAYAVTPGEGVRLEFGQGTVYDTAGLTACDTGLVWDGSFYAGAEQTVRLEPRFVGEGPGVQASFAASAGMLTETESGFRFTLPAQDAVISVTLTPTLSGSGTEEAPFLIGTAQDWLSFTGLIESGYDTAGLYFRQTDDLHAELPAGSAAHPFAGVYDGAGHTLDVRLSSAEVSCAPFAAIESATIENLRVTGTVRGDMHCSGLVGSISGSGVTIRNCAVEAEITTTGTHCGGLVGHGGTASALLEGCAFTGSILGGTNVGVLWGWSDDGAQITLNDCLEDGAQYTGTNVNPVGLGSGTRSVNNVLRTHDRQGDPARNWGNVGTRAFRLLPGENVRLTFGAYTSRYNVSDLALYPFGVSCGGRLYVPKDTEVSFAAYYNGADPQNAESFFTASAGDLAAEGSAYRLTMPEQDVTVDVGTHDWAEPVYTWSEDGSSVTAKLVCRHDPSHTQTETVQTERLVTRAATCAARGASTYTAYFKNPAFSVQTKTLKDIPANEHPWNAPTYVWSDDLSTVTATAVCRIDATHVLTETVKTNFILSRASTILQEGEGRYEAVFQNAAFSTQLRHISIPAAECDGGSGCPSGVFTDKPAAKSFAHIPIDWAVLNRVTLGTTATTFSPKQDCTRGQFVTFLWRTMGQPEPARTDNPFTDVKQKAFYYKAVLWAVEAGVTSGTSATTFSPNNPCTRAHVVTFLWRIEGSEEAKEQNNPFTDVVDGRFYYKAVLWAVEKGVTKGISETVFDPNGTCTRAQCVTFLYREFAK